MENIKIKLNGSDKQNSWAQDIVNNWFGKIDAEIEANLFRESGSKYYHIIDILRDYRNKAIIKVASMGSKDIIDMYTRKQNLDNYVISSARKAAENQIKEA